MDTIVSDAATGFASTTGFSLASVVDWMSDIILVFIGSGLAVLDAMKYWIVALIAIGVVVFFIFKGLRFFGASR